jgi:hypothetical protein
MFVPTPNGSIENVTIKTSNPLVEGEYALTSQVEWAQISTPPMNNTEGYNRSTNNNIRTFQQVSLLDGLNLTKNKSWTRSG